MAVDLLERSLTTVPLPQETRRAVICAMFDLNSGERESQVKTGRFDAYFGHWYEEQCEKAAGQVSATNNRQIIQVMQFLKSEDATRASIKDKLRQQSQVTMDSCAERLLDGSIDLAARLLFTLSIGELKHCLTPGPTIHWEHGHLADSIQTEISPDYCCMDEVKLPKSFTASNLEKIGGIRVCWTSNLSEHLMMKEDDTIVTIFHQASFLEIHKHMNSDLLSKDLIDETLRTLALLLPSSDLRSNKWFQEKQRRLKLDSRAGLCGHLNSEARQINNFKYWRDRLVILKQAFDDSEPRTVSQWWYDDRKRVQWYTFWVAALVLILTVAFGFIQTASGIIQAWASVRSMHH